MTIFGEKAVIGPEKCFTSSDLLGYTESLIKSLRHEEKRNASDQYSWLRSKTYHHHQDELVIKGSVARLKPMMNKMTPESCVAIAVKLERFVENTSLTSEAILSLLNNLLVDQYNIQMMETTLKELKRKPKNVFKANRVRPELLGREATVSFILETD